MKLNENYYLCPKRRIHINMKNRGTFVVDNKGRLQTKVKRGENLVFIASYLNVYPCSTAGEVRHAMMRWRGIACKDETRGQYASYFWDAYKHKWYYNKLWKKFKDESGKLRLNLRLEGMGLIDHKLCEEIKKGNSVRSFMFINDLEDVEKMEGYKYNAIIQ